MSTTTTTKTKTSKDSRQGRRFRTGCKTCKSRRAKIQCDETRPACNACVKQGRTCPGYQREFKWSTKHEVSSGRARRKTAVSEEGDSMTGVAGESPKSTGSTVEMENTQLEEAFDAVSGLLASEEDGDGDGNGIGGDNRGIPTVGSLDGLAELYGRIYGDSFGWLTGLDEDNQTQAQAQAQAQVVAQVQEDFPEGPQADLPVSGLEEDEVDEPAGFEALLQGDVLALEEDVPQPILSTPTMTETTTFLIEYWFKNVCSMWSSFDSDRNLIRKLASHTWSHNAAVFHSLQTMSALHLSEQLPHLHATATTSWTAAMQSIQQELASFTQHKSSPPQFPTGLLLALAGIGTTTCWTDSQQLGIPLLQKMKTILAYYNQPGMLRASTTDRTYLEFFNDSCAYWDILCRVVTDEQDATGPATTTLIGPIPGSSSPTSTTTTSFTPPHPWVGVSRHILDLFAHTILLCRRHSKRLRSPNHATLHSLQELIRDIHAARSLRQTLTSTTLQSSNLAETGDARTPLSHLVDVAEGYRLAALLHLYQTFPDLRDDHTRELGAADISTWSLQTLALELLDLVKRIPLESGSRVIQPLLYLSIATGLKAPDTQSTAGAPLLNQMALQVSQARRVVMQRVSVLEYSLPSKPIRVLKALIQRIWEVGDREGEVGVGGGMAKHWSEVMEEGRLRTMFG